MSILKLIKPLFWVGRSKRELMKLPGEVIDVFGFAFHRAQMGEKHCRAKPLKGFGGAGVLEVVDDFDGETYRAVYTVRFSEAIFVLHVFQKKSTQGIETPKRVIDLIERRLNTAEKDYKTWTASRRSHGKKTI